MLRYFMLFVLSIPAIVLGVAATRPDTFHIERSRTIEAAPEVVFAQINDLKRWSNWSPWNKLDPKMKKTFSGSKAGEGAVYHWVGNKQVGEGTMTIEQSTPPRPSEPGQVVMRLDFVEPYEGTSQSTFTLAAHETGTRVTWAMDGSNNFIGKIASFFMDMDAQVGGNFETGLENLSQTVLKARE